MPAAVAVLVTALSTLTGCIARPGPADNLPYRIVEHSLHLVTCSGDGGAAFAISSPQQLEEYAADFSARCTSNPDPGPLLEVLRHDLEHARVDLEHESLVLIQRVYGSGMIRARLELTSATPRQLTVTVVALIPDGPLTPDLSIQRFALAVARSAIDEVEVVSDGERLALLQLSGDSGGAPGQAKAATDEGTSDPTTILPR